MTFKAHEFIRRFLLHALPDGFLANGHRSRKLALCRKLLAATPPVPAVDATASTEDPIPFDWDSSCPCCGGAMITLAVLTQPCRSSFWYDTS